MFFKKNLFLGLVILFTVNLFSYKTPPKLIDEVFNAPTDSYYKYLKNSNLYLEFKYKEFISLERLAKEKLSLAGKQIYPDLNSKVTDYPIETLVLKSRTSEINIDLNPNKYNICDFYLSQNNHYLSIIEERETGLYLKVYDLTREIHLLYESDFKINNIFASTAFTYGENENIIYVATVSEKRKELPKKIITPKIEESHAKKSVVRTYQNLLSSKYDELLFDYYFTVQFKKIDLRTKQVTNLGKPGIYNDFEPSPDGKYIIVSQILKPYSYSVPYYFFPYSFQIWNNSGQIIKTMAKKTIQDEIPVMGVEKGMRYLSWINSEESTLYWAEAQDEGDIKNEVEYRDFLYRLKAPFTDPKEIFLKTKNRFGGISWFKNKGNFIVYEYDYQKEWKEVFLIEMKADFSKLNSKKELFSLSYKDKYNDPGQILTERDDNNYSFIISDGESIFLKGLGASKDGYFPFLDKMNLKTLKTERIFESDKQRFEKFLSFYDDNHKKIIIRSESKIDPPNYFVYELESKEKKQLSNNIDQAPVLRKIKKELVKYYRKDSLLLSGTLYFPPDYDPAKKYPLFIWAYPREFTSAKVASQVKGSQYLFTRFYPSSPVYMALHGYLVLNNAAMPVVGDVEKRNNTFKEQIVMNAKAAIDYLSERNIIDSNRVGIGGHSYGAFMTANLLSSCNLFKAGIARSGAYNRTLTPFGFQSERRTYWQAKDFYNLVSPFMNAEKIKTPLLLIHGEKDNNPGTYTIQSERMYDAIKGNEGDVRLVILPYESHGYRAKESNLHVLYEMCNWLDKYLKDDNEK